MHCPTLASACRVMMSNQSPRTRIECIGCSVSTISVGANTIPCDPDTRAGGDDDINAIREPCISNEVSANWLLISGQTVHNFMKRPKSFGVVREAATVRALTSQYGDSPRRCSDERRSGSTKLRMCPFAYPIQVTSAVRLSCGARCFPDSSAISTPDSRAINSVQRS
jgi:hypothetical protein